MKANTTNIFEYAHYRDFLAMVTRQPLARSQRPMSLKQWAQKLGYQSPRIVGMVLNGQRIPSPQMVRAWSRTLGLTGPQERFFELLVLLEREKARGKPVKAILQDLARLTPRVNTPQILDLQTFRYVADWFHFVIKQLAASGQVHEADIQWVVKKLRRKVTQAEVRLALNTLCQLGMLRKDAAGIYRVVTGDVTTPADVPSEAIRTHHKQMMNRAAEALDEQDVSLREFGALTFRVLPEQVPDIKQAIRDFRRDMEQRFSSVEATEVAQVNIQFFFHSQPQVTLKEI